MMIMDRDELMGLVANARWFANYYVRSKEISRGIFKVKTNYPWLRYPPTEWSK